MSKRPSARSASAQRRKKHTKKAHVGFRLYDEDADIAEQLGDFAPLHDWFTKLLHLARKPTRDYLQTLRQVLDIPLPDPDSEVATILMDKALYDRFTRISKELLEEHRFEPGPDQLMHLVLRQVTEEEIRRAALTHLEKNRPQRKPKEKS